MKLQGAFLASRIGRRIFLMFGLAVAVPALLVFWLTYRNAAALSERTDAAALRAENKHFALSVYDRLEMARLVLGNAAGPAPGRAAATLPLFSSVSAVAPASIEPLAGSDELGFARLLLVPGPAGRPAVALATRAAAGDTMLVGVLDPRYLWGDADAAVSDGRVCVDAGPVRLACLGEAPNAPAAAQVHDDWELFLRPRYGVESWTFRATRGQQADFGDYAGLIVPVALGLFLLALLLSSTEIRRILVPLESLVARIKAVGGGRADPATASDDEFTTLASAFGEMEGRIDSQLRTLRTLQGIDQLILTREPLSRVVETVLQRIAELLPGRPLALSLNAFDGYQARRHYLLAADATGAAAFQPGPDPLDDGGRSLQSPARDWQTTAALGPSFHGLGLASASYLTLGPADGPLVRLAVGNLAATEAGTPPAEAGPMLELVERVAVALTAEAHERKLVHQARHDLLTNLPNRLAVLEALPGLIRQADASSQRFAVLFIDLDRFKAINDGLGHGLGDSVLVEVSRRIRAAVGAGPLVARLGGDEFLVVIPNAGTASAVFAIDRAIRQHLQAPVTLPADALIMDFSGGVALYPDDGADAESLMHHADLAMYRAKRSGGGHTLAFEAEMNQSAIRRVQMEADLRVALREDQLAVEYQPRIDSRSGAIVGAEVLVRWQHPALGRVMPDDFISLAEECGLIADVGRFVIQQACAQLAQWKRDGLPLPLLAINVSSHQLRGGELFDTLATAIGAHGLQWSQMEVEITESVLVKDSAYASEQLQRLRDAGATVAIDDFGTGYSSLAYLTSLPTDTIKIDRAFSRLLDDRDNHAVVISIIALARALGKKVVAEGVERMEDVEMLAAWGCHVIQGYVFHRPMPADALAALLAQSQPQPQPQPHEAR
ncbi:MAG: EAL domain-containing protein [Lysobacteraceae bacterium]|nr:MAG: EAL domain-containing protein [Xanthomonadaceae bacterium]